MKWPLATLRSLNTVIYITLKGHPNTKDHFISLKSLFLNSPAVSFLSQVQAFFSIKRIMKSQTDSKFSQDI